MDPQSNTVEVDDAIANSDSSVMLTVEENEDESVRSTSSDIMDCDGTDFAAQLRKHRKQVLDKEAAATKNDFSDALRKHREHLVDTWEDNQPVDHNTITGITNLNTDPNPNEAGNTVTILSTLDLPQNPNHDHDEVENNGSKSDDQFFDTIPAPSEENLGLPTTAAASITSASSTASSDEIYIDADVADADQSYYQSNDKKIEFTSNILPNDGDDEDDDNDDDEDDGNSQVMDDSSAFRSLEQNAELELNGEKAEEKYLDSDEAPQRRNDDSDDNDNDDVVEVTKIIEDKELDGFDQIVLQSALDTDIDQDEKKEPNDLVDFDIAPTSLSQISVEENDDTPLQPSNDGEEEKSNNSDDDFGDFEDVDTSSPKLQSDQPNDAEERKEYEEEVDNDGDEDESDFGDFDTSAAKIQSEQPNDAEERKKEIEEEVDNDGDEDENENDFGGFEDVDTSAPKLQSEQPNDDAAPVEDKDDDDDDDDDFGEFDTAAPSLGSEQPKVVEENEENNGFGKFDAAPAEDNDDDDDEDDFGEFDTAAPSLESEQPKVVKENEEVDDDFGKFDAAPTLQSVVVKNSLTPLAPIGRINNKTRNIFAKMQALYSFLDSNDDTSVVGGSELLPEASVDTFLASSKATQEIEVGVLEHNRLDRRLKGAAISREENSTLIINDDGRGPFHCFKYPLAGLHAPHTDFDNKRQRRKSSMRARVPDVLPIQLPTGKEMPLETSSPVAGRRRNINISTVEITPFPGLSVSSEIDDESSSVGNKSFEIWKSKIPDLSFMLKSKLKFPNN
jgi:hypothetical protein